MKRLLALAAWLFVVGCVLFALFAPLATAYRVGR